MEEKPTFYNIFPVLKMQMAHANTLTAAFQSNIIWQHLFATPNDKIGSDIQLLK